MASDSLSAAMPRSRSPRAPMSTPSVFRAWDSTARSPTARAISIASSASPSETSIWPTSMRTCASAPSTSARSALGGSTGISSAARVYCFMDSLWWPLVHR